ncbi:MAG TPA: hypothetical protein VEL82_05425 [Thermoplasmata archaeon]|nr:hypothetical protein [Thermoplasmata archaeon]
MAAQTTTIQVDVEVRDRLRALGRMGESYDDVIRRLLASARTGPPASAAVREGSPPPARGWHPLQGRD